MKIDDAVEERVRAALGACVGADFNKLDTALKGIPNDGEARKSIELVIQLIRLMMRDAFQGEPTNAQIRAVAANIASEESWAEPTLEEVESFLLEVIHGNEIPGGVPAENAVILGFVVAAHILSAGRKDNEKWWNYLDRVEARLESA